MNTRLARFLGLRWYVRMCDLSKWRLGDKIRKLPKPRRASLSATKHATKQFSSGDSKGDSKVNVDNQAKSRSVQEKNESTPKEGAKKREEQSSPPVKFFKRSGTVPGMEHIKKKINNQDSFIVREIEVEGKLFTVGIVSDGCSGRRKHSRTEVGSELLTLYAFSEIRMLLALKVPLTEIPTALYSRCVSYVGNIARSTVAGTAEEMCSFIENHFLCTLLGFVTDGRKLVSFQSGDGFQVVNDQTYIVDQNDRPLYLGYHQIDRRLLGAAADILPSNFEVREFDCDYLARFAIGTDGILSRDDTSEGLALLAADREQLFEHAPDAPAGLQWWLNKQQNRDKRFSDDTTVITLQKDTP